MATRAPRPCAVCGSVVMNTSRYCEQCGPFAHVACGFVGETWQNTRHVCVMLSDCCDEFRKYAINLCMELAPDSHHARHAVIRDRLLEKAKELASRFPNMNAQECDGASILFMSACGAFDVY